MVIVQCQGYIVRLLIHKKYFPEFPFVTKADGSDICEKTFRAIKSKFGVFSLKEMCDQIRIKASENEIIFKTEGLVCDTTSKMKNRDIDSHIFFDLPASEDIKTLYLKGRSHGDIVLDWMGMRHLLEVKQRWAQPFLPKWKTLGNPVAHQDDPKDCEEDIEWINEAMTDDMPLYLHEVIANEIEDLAREIETEGNRPMFVADYTDGEDDDNEHVPSSLSSKRTSESVTQHLCEQVDCVQVKCQDFEHSLLSKEDQDADDVKPRHSDVPSSSFVVSRSLQLDNYSAIFPEHATDSEMLFLLKNMLEGMKTSHLIPPKEFEVVASSMSHSIPEACKFTDEVKVMNWILHPPWEQKASDKGYRPPKPRKTTDPGVMLEYEGGEIHVARACAIFSREKTLLARGMGRLSRWRCSQQWLQNLEKNMRREYVDVEPDDIVIWMERQGWSIGKVIQCVEVLDKKFVRVDSISLSSINAFALVELASSNLDGSYKLSSKFAFKAVEQAVETIAQKDDQIQITEAMKKNIEEKILEFKNLKKKSLGGHGELPNNRSITFKRNNLFLNTREELLVFCHHHFIFSKDIHPRSSKKALVGHVKKHMKKAEYILKLNPSIESQQKLSSSTKRPTLDKNEFDDIKGNNHLTRAVDKEASGDSRIKSPADYFKSAASQISGAGQKRQCHEVNYSNDIKHGKLSKIGMKEELETNSISSPEQLSVIDDPSVTRYQLARLQVPVPVFVPFESINVVLKGKGKQLTNVYEIRQRPSDATVLKALSTAAAVGEDYKKKIHVELGYEETHCVQIKGHGTFDIKALRTMLEFSKINKIREDLQKEQAWFSEMRKSTNRDKTETDAIKNLIMHCPAKHPLLTYQEIEIYPHNICTLVGERSVDSEIINYFFTKFNQTGNGITLSLPSTTVPWLVISADEESHQTSIISLRKILMTRCKYLSSLQQILIPLHMKSSHWGLVRVNLQAKTIGFDEGLRWKPEDDVPKIIRALLKEISSIYPHNPLLRSRSWLRSTLSWSRFGMPAQPKDTDKPGFNSCGVATILAARDLIGFTQEQLCLNKSPVFSWSFDNAAEYRYQLLNEIKEETDH